MKNNIILLAAISFVVSVSRADNQKSILGAKAKGKAEVSVAACDFWACNNNQAALGFYTSYAAGICYENRFLTQFTSVGAVAVVCPVNKAGVFSACVQLSGAGGFNQVQAGVAYSRAFGKYIGVGLQFDYLLNYFGESYYGYSHGFTFEAGIYGKVTPDLSLAFHVYNPARLRMMCSGAVKEYIPTLFRLGAEWHVGKNCELSAEVSKGLDTRFNGALAVEYAFASYLSLRAGMRMPDFVFSIGLGFRIKAWTIDVSSSYHTVLGYSPQISLVCRFKQHKDEK
ncbi:MAG: hypothetical protein J5701_04235 [Bacteroidales bacterium]|nr:hypothetical protein [Bacteroidales bacterium]